jgi:hypothetical protein
MTGIRIDEQPEVLPKIQVTLPSGQVVFIVWEWYKGKPVIHLPGMQQLSVSRFVNLMRVKKLEYTVPAYFINFL